LMLDYALGVGYQLMLDYVPIALDSWLAVLILYKLCCYLPETLSECLNLDF
jgi:hypothetical protein